MEVKVGQLWEDNDKRCRHAPRVLLVVELLPNGAIVENIATGRRRPILLRRFRPNSTGYRLIEDVHIGM